MEQEVAPVTVSYFSARTLNFRIITFQGHKESVEEPGQFRTLKSLTSVLCPIQFMMDMCHITSGILLDGHLGKLSQLIYFEGIKERETNKNSDGSILEIQKE